MRLLKRYFSRRDLQTVAEACAAAERKTSAEIRVAILEKRGLLERRLTLQELALREFQRLRMNRTKLRNGILIFILLKERKIYILADEGFYQKAGQDILDKIASEISEKFKQGKYLKGVQAGIKELGRVCEELFPVAPDDKDELSDEVSVR